ncbi:mRNA splicing protein [Martiniozyma asiatica (nom. inval.)]|nr:mRNA splicing protein [Martiniozyma asiatica]
MALTSYINLGDIPFEMNLLKDNNNEDIWRDYVTYKLSQIPLTLVNKNDIRMHQSAIDVLFRAVNIFQHSWDFWWELLFSYKLFINALKAYTSATDSNAVDAIDVTTDLIRQYLIDSSDTFMHGYTQLDSYLSNNEVKKVQFCNLIFEILVQNQEFVPLPTMLKVLNFGLKELKGSQHGIVWCNYINLIENKQVDSSLTNKLKFDVWHRYWLWRKSLEMNKLDIDRLVSDTITFLPGEDNPVSNITKEYLQSLPNLNSVFDKLCENVTTMDQFQNIEKSFNEILQNNLISFESSIFELENTWYECHFTMFDKIQDEKSIESLIKKTDKIYYELSKKFSDQKAHFAIKYAKFIYKIKSSNEAFTFYENELMKCLNVKDFSHIFNAYANLIDSHIVKIKDKLIENDSYAANSTEVKELSSLMDKFESLLNRRDILVNDINIKNNPDSVYPWLVRVKIVKSLNEKDSTEKMLEIFAKAVTTIKPINLPKGEQKNNLLPKLWGQYARLYATHKDLNTARSLYQSAINMNWESQNYSGINEREFLIIGLVNMELKFNSNEKEGLSKAIETMRSYVEASENDINIPTSIKKNVKLWCYYLDLIESTGDFIEIIRVYEEAIKKNIMTTVMLINFCNYLEENNWIDKCFSVYKWGISTFSGHAQWVLAGIYIEKVLKYYKQLEWSSEMAREAFEDIISMQDNIDDNQERSFSINLMYANWELKEGSKMRALSILKKCFTNQSKHSKRLETMKLLIAATIETQGLPAAEKIYQEAIESISVNTKGYFEDIVSGFIKLELCLGNIINARDVFEYVADAIMNHGIYTGLRNQLWDAWKKFELEHGDEATYKQMLKKKRYLESNCSPEHELVERRVDKVGFVAGSEGPKVTTLSFENSLPGDENLEDIINEEAIALDFDDFE